MLQRSRCQRIWHTLVNRCSETTICRYCSVTYPYRVFLVTKDDKNYCTKDQTQTDVAQTAKATMAQYTWLVRISNRYDTSQCNVSIYKSPEALKHTVNICNTSVLQKYTKPTPWGRRNTCFSMSSKTLACEDRDLPSQL